MRDAKTTKCPHCGKPAGWEDNPNRPFCSPRCRTIDLGNWAMEKYRVAGEKVKKEDEDEEK